MLKRFRNVHELAWGQSITLMPQGRPIRITALEVAHALGPRLWGPGTDR